MKFANKTQCLVISLISLPVAFLAVYGVFSGTTKVCAAPTEHGRVQSLVSSRWGVLIEGGGFGLSATKSLEEDEDIIFVRRAQNVGT